MVTYDMPPSIPPTTVVAQASEIANSGNHNFDSGIVFCRMVQPGPVSSHFSGDYELLPVTGASVLQQLKLHKFNKELWKFSGSAKVTPIQAPKHGTLVDSGEKTKYYPKPSYLGKDNVSFSVELAGYTIKVVYILHVQHGSGTDEGLDQKFCPRNIWKIPNSELSTKSG